MIGQAVFAKLSQITGNTLQNQDETFRIYPNFVFMADKDFNSYLVYDCEHYQPDLSLDGSNNLPTIDVKIIAVGPTYDAADALAKILLPPAPATQPLDGTMGTWGTTIVHGCFLKEVSEDHFVDTEMETILYYTKELVFEVVFEM